MSSGLDAKGNPTGYRETEYFDAAEREVAFGRHLRSDGEKDFVAMRSATPDNPNTYPKAGPLVFSEILYAPFTNACEFVEIRNITGAAVPLYDPAAPASTWRLSSGIDYAFPPGQSVAAYGTIVVCPTSPAVFRAFHGLAPEAPVYGPFTGKLDNAGESIRLEMPLDFDGTNRPFALVERVEYGAAFRPAATPLVDLPAGRLAVYRCRDLLPGRPAARPARVARTSAGSRTRRGGRRPLRPDEAGIRFASRASCFPRPAGFLTDPAGSGSTSALRRTAC